ncbi:MULTISPECIES: hypothetical protein [Candidatus Ichthyocystis]|nr:MULTISPECIES: hypothetical protein [Ichthyocystis]
MGERRRDGSSVPVFALIALHFELHELCRHVADSDQLVDCFLILLSLESK